MAGQSSRGTQRSSTRLTELRVTPAHDRPSGEAGAPTATFFEHLEREDRLGKLVAALEP